MPSVTALLRRSLSIFGRYPLQFAALASINVAPGFLVVHNFWLSTLWTLALLVIGSVVGAAIALAAASAATGAGTRTPDSIRTTVRRLKDLIELTLRTYSAFLLLVLTIVGIPFAVRILVRWFFGVQAVVLNDLGAKEAITESCRLVEGRWWRIAGIFLLIGVSLVVPVSVVALAWPGSIAAIAIRILVGLTIGPVLGIFWTLLFLQLRDRTVAGLAVP
jgi:hypothetical protein